MESHRNRLIYLLLTIILAFALSLLFVDKAAAATINAPATAAQINSDISAAIAGGENEIIFVFDGSLTQLDRPIRIANTSTGTITVVFRSSTPLTLKNKAGERHFFISAGKITLRFDDVTLDGGGEGGGIAINGAENVTVKGAAIQNCRMPSGGGLYAYESAVTLEGCTIKNNKAASGGGGGGIFAYNCTSLIISKAIITGNEAAPKENWQGGGGIAAINVGHIAISKSKINNNTADVKKALGGGLYIHQNTDKAVIENTEFIGNRAASGGGIDINGGIAKVNSYTIGSVSISGCTISDNKALYEISGAGGVFAQNVKTLSVGAGTVISGNTSTLMGGGLMALGCGAVAISEDSSVSGNSAAVYGGGVFTQESETLTLSGVKITGNQAEGNGGGLYIAIVDAKISNGLISKNSSAKANGGGVYLAESNDYTNARPAASRTSLTITNASELSQNSAKLNGGAIYTENFSDYQRLTAADYQNLASGANTIFSENTASKAYDPPLIAASYRSISYGETSIKKDGKYVHPINNYDINYAGKTYTVTYKANGGSGDDITETYYGGVSVTVAANTFSRSGYNFSGWNTEKDGTGNSYKAPNTFTMPLNDVILYAQWNIIGGGGEPNKEKDPDPIPGPDPDPIPTPTPTPTPDPDPIPEPTPEPSPIVPADTERPEPTPGRTLEPAEDGGFIELDENGTPMGHWTQDEDGVWIYEPYVPLGKLPQTGPFGVINAALFAIFALALLALVVTLQIKPAKNRNK